jgi:hypothetical protein
MNDDAKALIIKQVELFLENRGDQEKYLGVQDVEPDSFLVLKTDSVSREHTKYYFTVEFYYGAETEDAEDEEMPTALKVIGNIILDEQLNVYRDVEAELSLVV